MREYLNEVRRALGPAAAGQVYFQEAAFQCTTCGGCEYQCPVGIQHLPMIIGLRRGAVNTGTWEDEYGTKLFLTLERNGNSLGFPSSERQKFIEKNAAADLRWHAGILPVAGLHGRLRSARTRNRAGAGEGAAPSRHHFRRAAKGEMQRRPHAAARQRSACSRSWPRRTSSICAKASVKKAGLDLPALRAHHRRGLEGIRRGRSRSSITANCWRGCGRGCRHRQRRRAKGRVPRSLLSRTISRTFTRSRAP